MKLKFLLLFLYLISQQIFADSKYMTQARVQLALIKSIAMGQGWEDSTHSDKFDRLDNEESDDFRINLTEGKVYNVVSVCDTDCKDLDLILYDGNDNEIARDSKTDSMPVVQASPRWSGEFKLKVRMYKCESNPCVYGISVLSKDR